MFINLKDGNTFYDSKMLNIQLSDTAKYSVPRYLKHVSITAIYFARTVTSYKRLVQDTARLFLSHGLLANRSALVRIPAKRGISAIVELRSPDPSCNHLPCICSNSQVLLDGIKGNQIDPPARLKVILQVVKGKTKGYSLPGGLDDALEQMDKSLCC